MTKKLKLKSKNGISICRPEETLLNETLLANAIFESLKDNDTEAILEILEGYLSVLHKNKPSAKPLSHFFKSKNPTIKTIAKLVHEANS